MSDEALVRSWKDPQNRDGACAFHPAGEIRLGTGSAVGRRARLLSGLVGQGGYEGDLGMSVSMMTGTSVSSPA
ncbi:hypothetical protein GCM10009665_57100 [Kitasatospora nipponensis]|uniref:Uncharacterized protein n=1 Tax=Kitasatospora nipponensis TaxID=258049 RepID=A0ABP4HER2_9ACTN